MNVLELVALCKAFGGLQAIDNVNLEVKAGEISAIIGPNGAGKSTLFNLISGYFPPDSGKVIFRGRDITAMPPNKIAHLGIGRSFQRTNIFPRLTVFENVLVAVLSHRRQSANLITATWKLRDANARAMHILEEVNLADRARDMGGTLAMGDQKRLEIGIALAAEPTLILLDEPTAGMSSGETKSTVQLIEKLAHEMNMTLLFTEHDMSVVFSIAETIHVLHQGQIIAEGKPEEISQNERVIEAYLGGKE
jgi:branched-chain amino acid transport system ATP-binding protein